MLRRFKVDNFRTHINTVFEPEAVNLLIGVNNSGKTNLLQAMRFLAFTGALPLSKAASLAAHEEWTLSNAFFDKPTIDFEARIDLQFEGVPHTFDYELSVLLLGTAELQSGDVKSRLSVRTEKLTVSAEGYPKAVLLENDQGHVRVLHESKRTPVQTNAPTDATMLSRLYDLKTNPRANLFKKYLSTWLYYDIDSQQLRLPEATLMDNVLRQDGSNLASVLFNLKNANERVYRKLIEITQRVIEPNLEILSFVHASENLVFMMAEDSAGHRLGPWSMSTGTLRFMALAYVFLTQQLSANAGSPRLLLIEEPETGLYPGHLKDLYELVDPSGKSGQVVFTSHAPYFIDLFDGNLKGVTVAKRGERNSTLVKPDIGQVEKLLESMPLGELHFRELIA